MRVLAAASLLLLFAPAWASNPGEQTALAEDVSYSATPATTVDQVLFLVDGGDFTGSAFAYRHNDYILTNRHVVEHLSIGERVNLLPVVESSDGFTDLGNGQPAIVRYKHPDLDLAVLEPVFRVKGLPIRPAPRTEVRYLPRGTEVWAHGFPSTLSPTLSQGIISGHYRALNEGTTYYLTDVALAAGSSGGPVTDAEGQLIGIATAIYKAEEDLGFDWGFILPVFEIERALDTARGLSGLTLRRTPNELAASVKAAGAGLPGILAFRDAIQQLSRESGTAEEITRDLAAVFQQVKSFLSLPRKEGLVEAMDVFREIGTILMLRQIELAIREDEVSRELEELIDRTNADIEQWGSTLFLSAVSQLSPAGQLELGFDMMDSMTTALGESTQRAVAACDYLSGIEWGDEVSIRGIDRDALLNAISDLSYGSILIEAAAEANAELPSGARYFADRVVEHRSSDFKQAYATSRIQWNQISDQCAPFLGDSEEATVWSLPSVAGIPDGLHDPPVSTFVSVYGFRMDAPPEWMPLTQDNIQELMGEAGPMLSELASRDLLALIGDAVESGSIEMLMNVETMGLLFADTIVVTKAQGTVPSSAADIAETCKALTSELSTAFRSGVRMLKCRRSTVGFRSALFARYEGITPGTLTSQYVIDVGGPSVVTITATYAASRAEHAEDQFDQIVDSLHFH